MAAKTGLKEWGLIPAGWVSLLLIIAFGGGLGAAQLVVLGLVVLVRPILRLCFLFFMRVLYPTRVGKVHVWAMLMVRKYWLNDRRHALPIRVDLGDDASVHVVAGLLDNYTYIVVERATARGRPLRCAVVDPGDGDATVEALAMLREQHYDVDEAGQCERVVEALSGSDDAGVAPPGASQAPQLLLVVTHIFVTHKHWDHQCGVPNVLRAEKERTRKAHKDFPGEFPTATIEVVAGEDERSVRHATRFVAPGEVVSVGALKVESVPSPCHTKGHVMFALVDRQPTALFTGDTLFCGGCGGNFEGSPDEMAKNFRRIYHRCDDATLLFPGHEYTEALLLEYFGGSYPTPWAPRNMAALCHSLQFAHDARIHHRPSVPVVLGRELLFNAQFSSLHKAAATVCEAWRVFSRAINSRAASEEALLALHRNGAGGRRRSAGIADTSAARLAELLEQQPSSTQLLAAASGAPPAAENDDQQLASTLARIAGPSRGPRGRRSLSAYPVGTSSFVLHRATVSKKWRPGDRVSIKVGGVTIECLVPDGVRAGDAFDVRIPRDRLPRLLSYEPHDFQDPLTTVWTRDLERLHALVSAAPGDDDAVNRAAVLSRAVLTAPLRDVRDYDDPTVGGAPRPRTLLPRARYRGALDERGAQAAAEDRDDDAVHVASWRKPPAPHAVLDPDLDRALAAKRRVPDSYVALHVTRMHAPRDWRLELRSASHVYDALCKLSRTADDTAAHKTIEASELRRALALLGPRPLGRASIDELVDLAGVAECLDDSGNIFIAKLANVIAVHNEGDDQRFQHETKRCCCCFRRRRRRGRSVPPTDFQAELVELPIDRGFSEREDDPVVEDVEAP